MLNRRGFLSLTAAGLLCPRRARAATASDRQFLFVFCNGGWDTTKVFTPVFGSDSVDMDADATTATVNGIPFTDSPGRPSVRSFFETYGDRSCLINGMEVRSISHERCRRIAFTGRPETGHDDWGSALASRGGDDLLLPYVVISGTSFTERYTSKVVRVGDAGQLLALIDGSALTKTDTTFLAPSTDTQALADAFVRDQARTWASRQGRGRRQAFGDAYATALSQADAMATRAATLDLTSQDDGCNRNLTHDAAMAFDCFEQGIARCAMIRSDGWCDYTWDTHSRNFLQDTHYEQLFGYINDMLVDLDSRTADDGTPLRDRVTIVLMSEMGRTPKLNGNQGRDHWTFTSAMLIGSGVRGGQVIGAVDSTLLGQPTDLGSGAVTASGTLLNPGHLGATLLALADVDPGDEGLAETPIEAALA